jgi:hypothetical protein
MSAWNYFLFPSDRIELEWYFSVVLVDLSVEWCVLGTGDFGLV